MANPHKPIVVPRGLLADSLEVLQDLYTEIDALVESYEDYTPSGKLMDETEAIIDRLRGVLEP